MRYLTTINSDFITLDGYTDGQLRASSCINPYYCPTPIKYDKDLAFKVWEYTKGLSYPYRHVKQIPFESHVASALFDFYLALDAYYESHYNSIKIDDIINLLLKSDGASYLKKLRIKSFLEKCRSSFYETPTWWNDIKSVDFVDIGNIFNYTYFFHWEEECEDYKYGLIDVKVDEAILEEFYTECCQALDGIIYNPIPIEVILLKTGSSMTYTGEDKNVPLWMFQKSTVSLSSQRGVSKRCVIQVHPEGARDTVINQYDDLLRILSIEYNVSKLIDENFYEYTDFKDPNRFLKQYKKFIRKHKYFLCRDFTKEGITKPRVLLYKMLLALKEKIPCYAWDFPHFYDSYFVRLETNETISLKRGHGLGMANALTTFMQIILFRMTLKRMNVYSGTITMLTHNDDFICGFQHSRQVEEYWDNEETIMDGLSLIRNASKSFQLKHAGVFLENYFIKGELINKKESFYRKEVLNTLKCINVTHAKSYYQALSNDYKNYYFKEILSIYGWEFFKDEWRYPSTFGGWRSTKINQVDTSLIDLEELDFNRKIIGAYFASAINLKALSGEGNSPLKKINSIYNDLIEKEFYKYFHIGSNKSLKRYFKTFSHSPNQYRQYWEGLFNIRQKVYKNAPSLTWYNFTNLVIQYGETDFYPLEHQIDRIIEDYIIVKGSYKDPYRQSYGKLAYLSKLKTIPNIYPEKYSIFYETDDSIRLKAILDFFKNDIINFPVMEGPYQGYYIYPCEEDYKDIFTRLKNPIQYLSALSILKLRLPLPKIALVSEMAHQRIEVFGELLPYELIFNNLDFKDHFAKKAFVDLGENLQKILLEEGIDKYLPEPPEILAPKEEEISDEELSKDYVEGVISTLKHNCELYFKREEPLVIQEPEPVRVEAQPQVTQEEYDRMIPLIRERFDQYYSLIITNDLVSINDRNARIRQLNEEIRQTASFLEPFKEIGETVSEVEEEEEGITLDFDFM